MTTAEQTGKPVFIQKLLSMQYMYNNDTEKNKIFSWLRVLKCLALFSYKVDTE